MRMITSDMLREQLAAEVRAAGGQSAWAHRHGLSVGYVNDLIHERKEFSGTVAKLLGYERLLRFAPLNGKNRRTR